MESYPRRRASVGSIQRGKEGEGGGGGGGKERIGTS